MEDFVVNEHRITRERLSDILVDAFEGGSNTWYWIDKRIEPSVWEFVSEPSLLPDGRHWYCDYPFNPGGALMVSDMIDHSRPGVRVDWDALQKGLHIIAEKYPKDFEDILEEHDDAITGDVFFQCCVFGEVIYA